MTPEPTGTPFLASIGPVLQCGDLAELIGRLDKQWPPDRLLEFLSSSDPELVKTAVRCLGYTGSMKHCCQLVSLLGHADETVGSAAEDALWSIWMRAGSPDGNRELTRASQCIQREDYEVAIRTLRRLSAAEPSFAEAFHQLGMALHSVDRLDEAEPAYQQTVQLNPYHFAAVAGLGHICAGRSDARRALGYYRRALHIHPRLAEIRAVVPVIEAALGRRVVA